MSPGQDHDWDLVFDGARSLLRQELAGTYRVGELLGHGGMAHVFLAVDERTGAQVALKALTAIREGTGTEELRKRFRREADAMARLSHPNIVRILGSGVAKDLPYLVLEYVDAPTAAALLRQNPCGLPLEKVLTIARGVCDAVAFAHGRHFVHRDIKPANVFVRPDGSPVLADFGLVKGPDYTKMTRSGVMVGTPAYLCPEALTGASVDHRGDIYQLGLLIRELLTGTVFVPEWLGGLVGLQRSPEQALPLSVRRPDTPPWLVRVMERCLERSPDRRYQSTNELLAEFDEKNPTTPALAQLQDTPPVAQTPVQALSAHDVRPWSRRSVTAVAIAAFLVVASLAIGRWFFAGAPAPLAVAHFAVQPLRRALVAKVVTNRPCRAMVVCRTVGGEARTVESTASSREHEFLVSPLDGRQEYRVSAIVSADGATAQSTERTVRPGSRVDLARLRLAVTRRELVLSTPGLGESALRRSSYATRSVVRELSRTPGVGARWSAPVEPATSGSLSVDVVEADGRVWRLSGLPLSVPAVRLPASSLVGFSLLCSRVWVSGDVLRSMGQEALMAAVARSGIGRVILPLSQLSLRARADELDYLKALAGGLTREGVLLELVMAHPVQPDDPGYPEVLRTISAALGGLGCRYEHVSSGWTVDLVEAVEGPGWRRVFDDVRSAARRIDPSVGCSIGGISLQRGLAFVEKVLAASGADCLSPIQGLVPSTVRPPPTPLRQSLAGLQRVAERARLPLTAVLAYPIVAPLPTLGRGGAGELGLISAGARMVASGGTSVTLDPAAAAEHGKRMTSEVPYEAALRLLIRTTLEAWAVGCQRIVWMDPVHVLASHGGGGGPCGLSTLAVLAHWLDGARVDPDGPLAPALGRFGFESKDPSTLVGCVARRSDREFLVVWPAVAGSSRRLSYVGPGDVLPLVRLRPVTEVVAEVTFFDGSQADTLDVEEPLIIFPPLVGSSVAAR